MEALHDLDELKKVGFMVLIEKKKYHDLKISGLLPTKALDEAERLNCLCASERQKWTGDDVYRMTHLNTLYNTLQYIIAGYLVYARDYVRALPFCPDSPELLPWLVWPKHPMDYSQRELYESVYWIAIKWPRERPIEHAANVFTTYLLLLKTRLATFARKNRTDPKFFDGNSKWLASDTGEKRCSAFFFIDVSNMISIFERDMHLIWINSGLKHICYQPGAADSLKSPNNESNDPMHYTFLEDEPYCLSEFVQALKTKLHDAFSTTSTKIPRSLLQKLTSEDFVPAGENMRYGISHNGSEPRDKMAYVTTALCPVTVSHVTQLGHSTDIKIHDMLDVSSNLRKHMVLHQFDILCQNCGLDFTEECLTCPSKFVFTNFPQIILDPPYVSVFFKDTITHFIDIYDALGYWLLILSDTNFVLNLYTIKCNLTKLITAIKMKTPHDKNNPLLAQFEEYLRRADTQ